MPKLDFIYDRAYHIHKMSFGIYGKKCIMWIISIQAGGWNEKA
jgi:hypothetical protein